jgi:plastocyanin
VVVGGMDMQNMIEYHGFFPGEITINAGDSIWFAEEMPMFHTITFPGPGELPGIFIPDPEAAAPATPDAAAPPKLIYNPLLFTGTGGTVVDGSQLFSTAVDVFGDGTPWVLSFPKAGTYEYACIPHGAVMRGKVIVQEAGSALPKDQAAYDGEAAAQIATLQEQGLAEIEKYGTPVSTKRDDGTTLWEATVGAGGPTQVRVQRFLPDSMEITAGDTIKYVIHSEGEPHTVSFIGAGETPPEDTLVEAFADGSPKFVQNMETFLPQGGNVFSGKGWVNSGFMGIPQLGLPMEWEVTFDTPGEYVPFCRLHGDADGTGMAGKLTVKAAG